MNYSIIKFNFPIQLSERKERNGHFILEGFAVANDFDLQNDIISDSALRKSIQDFSENGKVCLNHTKEEIGKLLECHFRKGKIWVKLEIIKPKVIEQLKSDELNGLSIKGQVSYEKVERIFPNWKFPIRIIRDLRIEEVSIVPQGASPGAKPIRWYITKAIDMAQKNMEKNLQEDIEDLKKTEEGEIEDVEEEEEEDEEEETEEEAETEKEEEKKEEENEKEEDEEENEEETELTETYIEKSAYTSCMGKELKKGTPFKEAAKICSKKTKKEGKTIKMEKSAYTDCMKKEMKAGKTMAEAAKICKVEAKGTMEKAKEKYQYPYGYPYPYPKKDEKYPYPYGYPYGYPYRYPRIRKEDDISDIVAKLDKVIETTSDKKTASELEKIKNLISKLKVSPYPYPAKKELSEKLLYQMMTPGEFKLAEDNKFKAEVLRVGEWFHGASEDGLLKVGKDTLEKMVKNFKEKVLQNVFVPLGHTDDPMKNAGEVTDLDLSFDGEKLEAEVEIKDKTVLQKIKDGLIKYVSASFTEDYMKKDTGKAVGPTLCHLALVSEPYIKEQTGLIPLSEEFEGSLVVPLMNSNPPLTLDEITSKIEKIEIKLNECIPCKKEKESSEEVESASSEVSEKAEEEEEKEKTKSEAESAEKKGVDLADADRVFEGLLRMGKVTPAQKDLLLPLLSSDTKIELSEGKKVELRKVLFEYLEKESPKFSLEEEGTSETPKKEKKEEEKIPEEVDEMLEKMDLSEETKEETYKEFKKGKEGEKERESSTPF